MNTSHEKTEVAPTWRFWTIGIIALLWNGMGALDYTMTQTRNASYLSSFTPEQLAYFYGFPKWAIATWALSVWGGVLGSLALLLRKSWTVQVFAVSLVTMLITFFHNFVLTDGLSIMGGADAIIFPAVIVAIGIALLRYAQKLSAQGVLR